LAWGRIKTKKNPFFIALVLQQARPNGGPVAYALFSGNGRYSACIYN
jgi:hypothetical protein